MVFTEMDEIIENWSHCGSQLSGSQFCRSLFGLLERQGIASEVDFPLSHLSRIIWSVVSLALGPKATAGFIAL